MAIGCSGEKKDKTQMERQEVHVKQLMKNLMVEDIKLLAVKYDIAEMQLIGILDEYESMVKGLSIPTAQLLSSIDEEIGRKDSPEILDREVIDVTEALNRLSGKYGIEKKTLSSIIIDRRMMERATKGD